MKKALPIIASIALGGLFVFASIVVLFNLMKAPPPPEGSPAATYFGVIGSTGYLKFIKIFELVGGILVMIPRMRNIGLLLLGPVIVNIVAFHIFIAGDNLKDRMTITVLVLALYLLWDARKKFSGLLN